MCRFVSEAFATGADLEVEVPCGQTIYSLIFAPILDADYVNVYGRDITERQQAEEALRESEERYRGLFEHMLEGFAYCRMIFENGQARDWIYLAVNDMFETLTGLKDVTGKRVSQVIPGIREADPELFDIYARVSLTGKPEKFEMFVAALQMWFSISVYSPEKEFFVAVFDVITERKRAEEALRSSMERLGLALDAAQAGSWEWDLRTNKNIWSEELWKVYGLEPHSCEPSYEAWRQTIHPDDRAKTEQIVQDAAQDGTELNAEWRVRNRDSTERTLMSRGRPVRDADGQVARYIGIVLDITERKRAEEEVRKLNAELEQRVAARTAQLEAANQELEAFAYSVSHDLRAPLRAIDGFSRIVLEDYADRLDAEGMRLLNIIRNNAVKMDRLIADLLALSRVSRGELRSSRIDMTGLARAVYHEIAAPEVQQKFDFSVAPLPDAQGDPTLMRRVWDNLIANALKYTMPRDERRIEIGGYAENGMNVYYVKDSGVGFDSDYAHKLFGVFQRLHKEDEFEGTGVGLAIVQRIVHRHGGRTWAEGKIDQGATVYFSLPDEGSDDE
jgi:PAS domain S-box-containing protein